MSTIQPCPGCAATNQVQLERIAKLEADLAAAQAEAEKLREWQVRKNGEIIDLQGALLDAEGKIERLMKEAAALRAALATVIEIPKMTDDQLEELKRNCRAAIEARKEGV